MNRSVNNAHDVRDLLKKIDFNVTLYTDIGKCMLHKVVDFIKTIKDGDCVLFYFSGHAEELHEENYLISVDDDVIGTDTAIADIGVSVERIVRSLTHRNYSNATVFILDCYKPYVFKSSEKFTCK